MWTLVNIATSLHSMHINLFLQGAGQLTVISRPWLWVGVGDIPREVLQFNPLPPGHTHCDNHHLGFLFGFFILAFHCCLLAEGRVGAFLLGSGIWH